ncbi:general secretion pathway protein E [Vibrio ponticus]|nr:general secretion pathway protein E [Vibrio ponticus]
MDMPIATIKRRLPFSFAKRFNLVLEHEQQGSTLYYVEPLAIEALLEVRRAVSADFAVQAVAKDEFEKKLTQAYQRDSSEARQLMEEIGADSDDFFSLAEDLPQDADLLESEDDAPIIKLINAMLGEAIKEGASDIHIETFEKSLSIRFRVDGVVA